MEIKRHIMLGYSFTSISFIYMKLFCYIFIYNGSATEKKNIKLKDKGKTFLSGTGKYIH